VTHIGEEFCLGAARGLSFVLGDGKVVPVLAQLVESAARPQPNPPNSGIFPSSGVSSSRET
jgi:hypothetical protein